MVGGRGGLEEREGGRKERMALAVVAMVVVKLLDCGKEHRDESQVDINVNK